VGDIQANLADWLNKAEHELPSRYAADFKQPIRLTTQCVYVQLPQTSVLVDVNTYEGWSDTPYFLPGYQPPPGLLDRLVELGRVCKLRSLELFTINLTP
jgi:hypothetical protein